MSEWPKDDKTLAKQFGRSVGRINGYRHTLRKKGELVPGEDYTVELYSSNSRHRYLWYPSGALKVAKLCTSPSARAFCIEMGSLPHQPQRTEDDSLGIIMAALEGITPYKGDYLVRDYPNGTYKIDLYLPWYKIAIECDEDGHKSYARCEEERRRNYIEQKLSCHFIRFDPHEAAFNVGHEINKIFKRILAHNSKQPGKEGQVLQSSSPA